VWVPKAYTGTYGTNGFKLDFADNASTTTIGYDAAGSNDWTANHLSVTAGAGNDILVDVPVNGAQTDTGVGGEVRGNYATFNPLASAGTFSNGNLQLATSDSGESSGLSSIGLPMSGKWYWEVTMDTIGSDAYTGITDGASRTALGNAYVAYRGGATFVSTPAASNPSAAASYTTGDILGLAFNADSLSLAFYKNGVIQGTTTGIASRQYFTLCYCYTTAQRTINFGQRPFAYTAPSGFKALNTANLPAPVVTKPSDVFDVKLYTGNGSTQTISGLGFSPDFVWYKSRVSAVFNHGLFDIVRGAQNFLASNSTSAELGSISGVTAFNSDGFTVGNDAGVNTNGAAMVAWTWDAGSSTVTNTVGSISSQVRANASAGFSVVTFSIASASASIDTFGHGLGIAPSLVILKVRNVADEWTVYHGSISSPTSNWVTLNTTNAAGGGTSTFSTSSTTFGVRGTRLLASGTSGDILAYCFAPVEGYSAFGSYIGNGSSDGSFVYTGMRPRWVLIRRTDTTENWILHDTARDGYNVTTKELIPNSASAEGSTTPFDILSNGFKLRDSGGGTNASGGTYIYFAVAEHPFQYSRAR
jgi:hypothetical protein